MDQLAGIVRARHYRKTMFDDDPQYLYEIRGRLRIGRPLYIGISDSVPRRMSQHRREKDWWPENGQIRWKQYPDRPTVATAERAAIHRKHPVYNKQHNTYRLEVSADIEL